MSPETHPEEAEALAATIAEIWNALAKENGWPASQTAQSVRRNRRALANAMKGMKATEAVDHSRSRKTLLTWMLSRWNWTKSPAPLELVASAPQWAALAASLAREAEETRATEEDRLRAVSAWVEKERAIRQRNGVDPARAKREIEEFAKATRKISAWTREEQEHFYKELEKCQ